MSLSTLKPTTYLANEILLVILEHCSPVVLADFSEARPSFAKLIERHPGLWIRAFDNLALDMPLPTIAVLELLQDARLCMDRVPWNIMEFVRFLFCGPRKCDICGWEGLTVLCSASLRMYRGICCHHVLKSYAKSPALVEFYDAPIAKHSSTVKRALASCAVVKISDLIWLYRRTDVETAEIVAGSGDSGLIESMRDVVDELARLSGPLEEYSDEVAIRMVKHSALNNDRLTKLCKTLKVPVDVAYSVPQVASVVSAYTRDLTDITDSALQVLSPFILAQAESDAARKFPCRCIVDDCNSEKLFGDAQALVNHLRSRHPRIDCSDIRDEKGRELCPLCPHKSKFYPVADLAQHKRSHLRNRCLAKY